MSGIIPVHVIPKDAKPLNRRCDQTHLLVHTLPPTAEHAKPKRKTSVRHSTEVDQIVDHYLHRGNNGHVMPFLYRQWDGLICACCAGRNRDSFERKQVFQRGRDFKSNMDSTAPKEFPEQHIRALHTQGLNQRSRGINSGGVGAPVSQNQPNKYQIVLPHPQQRWGNYQPNNVRNLLNPQFSGHFFLQASQSRSSAQNAYINSKILEATTKYNDSINKLQKHYQNCFILPEGAIYLGPIRNK